MIYSHKPQRSGRSISFNTNNPPQDPPSQKSVQSISFAPPAGMVLVSIEMKTKLQSTIQLQKIEIEKLTEYQNAYESLKSENNILESNYESLKSENNILESNYQIQQTTLEQLAENYDTLKTDSITEYNILESKYQLILKKLEQAKDEHLQKIQQITTLDKQLEKLNKEYSAVKENKKRDKLEFEEKTKSHKSQLKKHRSQLKEEISVEKKQSSESSTQLTKIRQQLERLSVEYDTLKTQSIHDKDVLETKHQSKINDIEKTSQKHLQEKQKAKQQVNALEIQIEKLNNEYNEIKENSTSIQLELRSKIKEEQTKLEQLIDNPVLIQEIPDVLIEDSTPPVPDVCIEKEKPHKELVLPKKSLFREFLTKVKSIFRRK